MGVDECLEIFEGCIDKEAEKIEKRIDEEENKETKEKLEKKMDELLYMAEEHLGGMEECLYDADLDFNKGLKLRDLEKTFKDCMEEKEDDSSSEESMESDEGFDDSRERPGKTSFKTILIP